MKILHVTSSRLPSADANAVQATAMASALAEHADVVLTGNRQGSASEDEIRRTFGLDDSVRLELDLRRSGGWRGSGRYAADMRRLVRTVDPDMVYGRDPIGLIAAATTGLPVTYEIHQPPASRSRAVVERTLLRFSRLGLVFITESLRRWYQEHTSLDDRVPTVVLPDGATPSVGGASFPPPRERRVGYFGSLHGGKGIELITRLGELLTDTEFHVFGGQPAQVTHWRSMQRSDSVQFHGWIPHSEVRARMQEMAVLVAPYGVASYGVGGSVDISRFMSPLKVFEYLAAGRPIVASDLPVLREILDHGRTALLCDPCDIGCWRDAITEILENPELGDALAATGFDELCGRFSWAARATRLLDLMKSL